MEHEVGGDISCSWCTWDNPQRIGKGTGRFRNKRTDRDHPNLSITKIDQNTEKNPEVPRRLAVTQTPVRTHQLTPVRKTQKSK